MNRPPISVGVIRIQVPRDECPNVGVALLAANNQACIDVELGTLGDPVGKDINLPNGPTKVVFVVPVRDNGPAGIFELTNNAVLKHELPDHVQIGDVAQALQRTDELEVKINDTAQDLAQVNEVLAQEIDQRVDLERELAETKAALAEAKTIAGLN